MDTLNNISWLAVLIDGVIGIGVGLLFAWLTGGDDYLVAAITFALTGAATPIVYEFAKSALADAPVAAAAKSGN